MMYWCFKERTGILAPMFNTIHGSWKKWAEAKAETFLSSEEIIVEKIDRNRWAGSAWCGRETFTLPCLSDVHRFLWTSVSWWNQTWVCLPKWQLPDIKIMRWRWGEWGRNPRSPEGKVVSLTLIFTMWISVAWKELTLGFFLLLPQRTL